VINMLYRPTFLCRPGEPIGAGNNPFPNKKLFNIKFSDNFLNFLNL